MLMCVGVDCVDVGVDVVVVGMDVVRLVFVLECVFFWWLAPVLIIKNF